MQQRVIVVAWIGALWRQLAWLLLLVSAGLALTAPARAAATLLFDLNGRSTAPPLVFTDDAVGWTVQPSQNMLLSSLGTTFGRVPGSTALGTVLPRSVRISVYEGNARGALKARASVFVDALGGAKEAPIEPVLLLAGQRYLVAFENIRNIGATIVDATVMQPGSTIHLPGWSSGADLGTFNATFSAGVAQPLGAPILRLNGTPVTVLPQVDCLLAWAEQNYPGLFAPRNPASQTLYTFYYRHYPQTGTYLGISAADENVYVMEGNGIISNVGALSQWLQVSRCQPKR